MYREEEFLMISGIQHFVFCRRQWALIHVERLWKENYLTAKGRLEHERVHDAAITEKRGDVLCSRGIPVRSYEFGISGVCDAVEFTKSSDGVPIRMREGLWQPMPVEYKHGSAKEDDSDRLQLAAQSICLEEMLCCRIDSACLFYEKTRRRECVAIDEMIRDRLAGVISEMRKYYEDGYTPKVRYGKRCNACSMTDLCMPELSRTGSVSEYIHESITSDKSGNEEGEP